MSFQQLPIDSSESDYTIDLSIDYKLYRFNIYWNPRGEFWVIMILDSNYDIIAVSKIVTNYPLFFRSSDKRLPQGIFWVVDTTEKGLEPTRDNLGSEILIIYEDDRT